MFKNYLFFTLYLNLINYLNLIKYNTKKLNEIKFYYDNCLPIISYNIKNIYKCTGNKFKNIKNELEIMKKSNYLKIVKQIFLIFNKFCDSNIKKQCIEYYNIIGKQILNKINKLHLKETYKSIMNINLNIPIDNIINIKSELKFHYDILRYLIRKIIYFKKNYKNEILNKLKKPLNINHMSKININFKSNNISNNNKVNKFSNLKNLINSLDNFNIIYNKTALNIHKSVHIRIFLFFIIIYFIN